MVCVIENVINRLKENKYTMYKDTLIKSANLVEQAASDNSTVFVATISPDGNIGNATFYGDAPKMIKLLTSLIKLADQRKDGAVLKAAFIETFSKGILEIQ